MAPEITHYDWRGGREAMLRWGAGGEVVLIVPPLFEEANRARAILTDMARRIATTGLTAALPDLPAQNDSLLPTDAARLTIWRDALAAAAESLGTRVHVAAVRAGALIDADVEAATRWYWSPLTGPEQVRELERLRTSGDGETFGGNVLARALIAELAAAQPMTIGTLRTLRLDSDPRPADRHIPAAPPWRRSEPGNDPALAALLADDIADWIAACAG